MKTKQLILAAFFAVASLFPNNLQAQDGSLDLTFSGDGKLTTPVGSAADDARAIAIQPDGKILLGGYADIGGQNDFALVRYNTDGTLDLTFDTDGMVTTAIGSGADLAYAISLQSDGKILLAGRSSNGSNDDFALVRYNADGSLDTSFDTDGKLTTALGSSFDEAYAMSIQSDGKILLAGLSNNGVNNDFALVRYNTDGSLDTSFDTDGRVTTAIGTGYDAAHAMTIQSDGKILLAGYSNNAGTGYDFAVVRYNTDGSLDTSFDTDGKAITVMGTGASSDEIKAIEVQSDGKILVAGQCMVSGFNDFALARYNANGSLDTSFDIDGKATTGIGSTQDYAKCIKIQPNGKILVGGYTTAPNDFALVRFNANGSLDLSFDTDGKVTTNVANSTDVGSPGTELEFAL